TTLFRSSRRSGGCAARSARWRSCRPSRASGRAPSRRRTARRRPARTASRRGTRAPSSPTPVAAGGAVATGADELGGVLDLDEVVLLRDPGGPALDDVPGQLDRGAALAADQVVVVAVRAAAVERLAVLDPQHVDVTGLGHRLQGAVDGREPDRPAGLRQLG